MTTLEKFYENVQPAGAWSPVHQRVLTRNSAFTRETAFSLEALNTLLALIGICALYIGTLYLILHRQATAMACFSTTVAMCVALYFTWYKHLPPPALVTPEEEPLEKTTAVRFDRG
jgi:hypothetical protein